MDRLEKWKTIVFLNDFNDWSFNEETNETDVNWTKIVISKKINLLDDSYKKDYGKSC